MTALPLPLSRNIRGLLGIGLAVLLGLVYAELSARVAAQAEGIGLSPGSQVALSAYAVVGLTGLMALCLALWKPAALRSPLEKLSRFRWLIAPALLLFLGWVYIFSPLREFVAAPWMQLLVALGAAQLAVGILDPGRTGSPDGYELAYTAGLFLFPRMVREISVIYPLPALTPLVTGAGLLLGLASIALLNTDWSERLRAGLIKGRARLGGARPALAALFLLAPFLYRLVLGAGGYILYPNIRFAVVLSALLIAAGLLCRQPDRLFSLASISLSAGWLVLVSAVTRSLLLVVDDPFSLSWSEGNRFYDYSLVFAQHLYNYAGRIPDPYSTPGRYGLWGALFLWQGLPIWAHRLWNVILLILPSFILAWALTRTLQPALVRLGLFLWITAFFIIMAPLHPPFMLIAILVALFAFHPSPYVRGASLAAAGLYAGLSRWTWAVAPGAWGALGDLLLYYPRREGGWLRRLAPAILLALAGSLPGLLLNQGNIVGMSTGESPTAQQPLLWYRLLPNPTLGPGVLLLLLITTAPLLGLLVYMLAGRRWKWDLFQHLAVWGALGGFLAAGLVISAKIGGGGDLHNTDLFIMTLVLVAIFALAGSREPLELRSWPAPALALLGFMLLLPAYQFTPFYSTAAYHQWLDRPSQRDMQAALDKIRRAVDEYSQRGEVLFMDQRQLLTFGYVKAIPFVPEYEKKYMMDQALASNKDYFEPYYADLAARRFTLIVTEPLKLRLKGQSGIFSDESDLWVVWVSRPTMCFYEPIWTDKSVGVQMLVPRQSPAGCEKYLQRVEP